MLGTSYISDVSLPLVLQMGLGQPIIAGLDAAENSPVANASVPMSDRSMDDVAIENLLFCS